jgi:hypothetical protein
MSRPAPLPVLLLLAIFWLIAGVVVAGLAAGALGAGALVLGFAVWILGPAATNWLLQRRAAPPPQPGGIAPNTLRNDAVAGRRSNRLGPATPVPTATPRPPSGSAPTRQWGSGSPPPSYGPPPSNGPPPASSATTRAAGAQTPTRPAGASDRLRPASRLPVILGLVAGLVYLYQVEVLTSDVGAWFIPVFLLLMAGVSSAGVPQTQQGSSPLAGAIAATAPFALVTAATALDGTTTSGGLVDVVVLFLVAWAAIAVGRVIGRAMAAIRGA